MRISATGIWTDGLQKGFTLLELLVVLVIIGIVVTFATLAIGNSIEQQISDEARRFIALTETASNEAMLQGRELGLRFDEEGYQFMFLALLDDGSRQWQELQHDLLLRARGFPPEISARLILEDRPQTVDGQNHENRPQILLLSSGERTPFRLQLSSRDKHHVRLIEGGPFGFSEAY